MYTSTIKRIVKQQGGYREKEVMQHPYTVEKSETWNADHKVVNVLSVVKDADGYRGGFQIDLVTGSICG